MRYGRFFVGSLLLLMTGCITDGIGPKTISVSGVVIDSGTGQPLSNVAVELYAFRQESLLRMGHYKLIESTETLHDGSYLFFVGREKSLQIRTGDALLGSGGSAIINGVEEDVSGLVVKHRIQAIQ